MAANWREVALESIASDITVGHVGPMASAYVEKGIPFLRSMNVDPLRINDIDLKFISEEFHQQLKKSALSPGDVVIVRTGKPGACAVIPASLPIANCSDLVIVRCGPNLDPRFLAYSVNSVAAHHIAAHLVGAVQQHFNVGSARTMRLLLPPIQEQRAIAHVLGALDDKIELNRRMNETLEAMARALFNAWFVDFESGEMPADWNVVSLDEIATFTNGLALQKFPAGNGPSLPVVKIAQLNAGHTRGADIASANINPAYIVDDGDILFSWSGSLECKLWAGGRGALNQHLFKVTSPTHPKWLAYLGVLHHLPDFRHIAAGKATTMGHIQRHHLSDAKLAIPPPSVLAKMDQVMQPIVESIWQRNVQSRTLASIRDALLPRLISGDLRINADRTATST